MLDQANAAAMEKPCGSGSYFGAAEALGPDLVVHRDAPVLTATLESRAAIRAVMDVEEINSEIQALSNLAAARYEFGDFTLLGLKPLDLAYGCIDSGTVLLAWLHPHERARMHVLKNALPTQAEEAESARARILARRAARRAAVAA